MASSLKKHNGHHLPVSVGRVPEDSMSEVFHQALGTRLLRAGCDDGGGGDGQRARDLEVKNMTRSTGRGG